MDLPKCARGGDGDEGGDGSVVDVRRRRECLAGVVAVAPSSGRPPLRQPGARERQGTGQGDAQGHQEANGGECVASGVLHSPENGDDGDVVAELRRALRAALGRELQRVGRETKEEGEGFKKEGTGGL